MRTDAQLLKAATADPGAFRALYERHASRIHAFHLRRSRDPDAAHDLTAETFAQAWLSQARFRDEVEGSALPWLFAIARHVLAASVRKRTLERTACERLGILERLDRPAAQAEPDATWLDGEVDDILAGLPVAQQDAIRLHVLDELDYDDVGRALGTTPGAARVRVHRGLTTLRNRLTDRQEATP